MTISYLTSPASRADDDRTWSPEHRTQILTAAAAWRRRDPYADPAGELYRLWYAACPESFDWHPWWPPVPRALRAAHAGARTWTEPIPVVAVGLAGTVVTRDAQGVPRAHSRGDYLTVLSDSGEDRPGHDPAVGSLVRTLARGGAHVAEGWWRTWGGGWRPSTATVPDRVSRIYLAPRADRLTGMVRRLTAVLDEAGLPWLVKAGTDPATLSRADGVVVYLPDEALTGVGALLVSLIGGLVADRQPPLTCRLAPGIAWAHDPGDGDSFGQSRCAVLAAALAEADLEASGADVLTLAAEAFHRRSLDPAAPHLRADAEAAS